MAHDNHQIARAYFDAVRNGSLPDALLTSDMFTWTTLSGAIDKAGYQNMVKMLGEMCAQSPSFTVKSLTAEEDRVVAEVDSEATLLNGEEYRNTYIFVFRIHDGRICFCRRTLQRANRDRKISAFNENNDDENSRINGRSLSPRHNSIRACLLS
jgi:ketosteroid isomerase-like protein